MRSLYQALKSLRGHSAVAYFEHKPDPLTSLILTLPVFLVYHLGILAIDVRNGVDFVTHFTLELLDRSLLGYVALTLLFATGLLLVAGRLRKRTRVHPKVLLPLVIESSVWALFMLFTVSWATEQVIPWQVGVRALGPIEKIVLSCGAGFHEELVFRVVLFAGGAYLLRRTLVSRPVHAYVIAAVVSSLVFSLVHYIGPLGDSFNVVSFTFRVLTGLFLAGLYRLRGFAVAVYAHTLYDLFVLFFA